MRMFQEDIQAKYPVGVVIPAHNEAENISEVLNAISRTNWIKQVVIVDDQSRDSTLRIANLYAAQQSGCIVVHQERQGGKGAALLLGVEVLDQSIEHVIFLDADLIGVLPDHIFKLYEPVLTTRSDMAVAVFKDGSLLTDLSQNVTPILNGQRSMKRKDAIHVLGLLKTSGYGVEVGLSTFARQNNWRIEHVFWQGVTQVIKEDKLGLIPGWKARGSMYREIVATWLEIRKGKLPNF